MDRKNRRRSYPLWLCSTGLVFCLLTGCSGAGAESAGDSVSGTSGSSGTGTASESGNGSSDSAAAADFAQTDADMFTDRDYETDYDESECVRIELNGDTASASSDSVKISGTTVTITEEAVYLVTGTLEDGMIVVDAPDTAKLQIVLDGVDINSATSAPLYILEAAARRSSPWRKARRTPFPTAGHLQRLMTVILIP